MLKIFYKTLTRLIKEDCNFWSCLWLISGGYLIFCLHESYIHGWHSFYFAWLPYLIASPIILLVKWINEQVKLSLTILETLAKFIIAFNMAYLITPNLLTTPYPFVDMTLLHIDQWMHIHSVALMQFTIHHEIFKTLIIFSYTYMSATFILLILFLALMGENKRVNEIIVVTMIALFIASITFYYFPAFGPGTVLHSPLFPNYAATELAQYQWVQHGLSPLGPHYFAGFVSIPSIHCFIASIGIYTILTCKKYRLYLLPLLLIDALIIVATMFLGEHYFIDLVAAELLLGLIITGYKLCQHRYNSNINLSIKLDEKLISRTPH